jgi:hypothetical protein
MLVLSLHPVALIFSFAVTVVASGPLLQLDLALRRLTTLAANVSGTKHRQTCG